LFSHDQYDEIVDEIEHLPPLLSVIAKRCLVDDNDVKDVAADMGLRLSTARARLTAAKRRLREIFANVTNKGERHG
jgi:DNA-directed RNA polymerase specialized sigma24 family protein